MKTISENHQKLQQEIAEAIESVLIKSGVIKTEKTTSNVEKAAKKIVKEFHKAEKKAAEEKVKEEKAKSERSKKDQVKKVAVKPKNGGLEKPVAKEVAKPIEKPVVKATAANASKKNVIRKK